MPVDEHVGNFMDGFHQRVRLSDVLMTGKRAVASHDTSMMQRVQSSFQDGWRGKLGIHVVHDELMNGLQMRAHALSEKDFGQPTLPSISRSMRRFNSTLYSIGNSFARSLMKPLTLKLIASASVRPRCMR
jgi:hypothetical protein